MGVTYPQSTHRFPNFGPVDKRDQISPFFTTFIWSLDPNSYPSSLTPCLGSVRTFRYKDLGTPVQYFTQEASQAAASNVQCVSLCGGSLDGTVRERREIYDMHYNRGVPVEGEVRLLGDGGVESRPFFFAF